MSLQEKLVKAQALLMDVKNKEVERAVEDLIHTIQVREGSTTTDGQQLPQPSICHTPDVEGDCAHIRAYYNHVVFKAVLAATTASLNLIKNRVGGKARFNSPLSIKAMHEGLLC